MLSELVVGRSVVEIRWSGWPAVGATNAAVAQLVERVLGKDEVKGSSPFSSSSSRISVCSGSSL